MLFFAEIFSKFHRFSLTCKGSFSAVSKPIFATKYSFCSIFRDLQDSHSFAPFQSQNSSKNVVTNLAKLKNFNFQFNSIFASSTLKLLFFFEISMKFHRNFTECQKFWWTWCCKLQKSRFFQKIPKFCRNILQKLSR